jgi:hypothetical protein
LDDIEFVEADPKLRRTAVMTVLAVTALGSITIAWLLPWMLTALEEANAAGTLSVPLACWIFLGMVVLLAAPVVAFGVYAARFGRAVATSGQYPPPGTRVVRRTRVLRGPAATFVGRGQLFAGVTLVLCGIALVVVAAWGVWLLAFARRTSDAGTVGAPSAVGTTPTDAAPPAAAAELPREPIARRAVLFMEATEAQIEAARAGVSADDFAVVADDLMFYRAAAHERLAEAGAPVVRVDGRRPLAFVVDGAARTYDFPELATLDLIVVYVPGSAPSAFATIDVERALEALSGSAALKLPPGSAELARSWWESTEYAEAKSLTQARAGTEVLLTEGVS